MIYNACRGLLWKNGFAYIDGGVIFGDTLEEHKKSLELVLLAIQKFKDLGRLKDIQSFLGLAGYYYTEKNRY